MTNLSAILAAIETSIEKTRRLDAELAVEARRRRALVYQYSAQSSDGLRELGLEMVRKRRAQAAA